MIKNISIILLNPSEELITAPLPSYSKKIYEILNLLLPHQAIRPEILNLIENQMVNLKIYL